MSPNDIVWLTDVFLLSWSKAESDEIRVFQASARQSVLSFDFGLFMGFVNIEKKVTQATKAVSTNHNITVKDLALEYYETV